MKLLISIVCFLVAMSLNAQVVAVQAPDSRITIVTNPIINFSQDQIAIYKHTYYLVGGAYQNQLETYNWRASLVTNGSGWYVIHTFVWVYERQQDGSLLAVDRKKYYTRVYIR
jgi:hypothetical protein